MGELPFTVTVDFGTDMSEFTVYVCLTCRKEFLIEEWPEVVYCPYCGSSEHTDLELEYT